MVTVQSALQAQTVGVHHVQMTSQVELRGKHLDCAQHAHQDQTAGDHLDLQDQMAGAHPVLQAQLGAQHALLQA